MPHLPIHLEITPSGKVFVRVEHEGRWVDVIREHYCEGGVISHIVEALGIEQAIQFSRSEPSNG